MCRRGWLVSRLVCCSVCPFGGWLVPRSVTPSICQQSEAGSQSGSQSAGGGRKAQGHVEQCRGAACHRCVLRCRMQEVTSICRSEVRACPQYMHRRLERMVGSLLQRV
jgi:hypothetical protein